MSETKTEYVTNTTNAPSPRRRAWTCQCGAVLGGIVEIGKGAALSCGAAVIVGDAWVECARCGAVRQWRFVHRVAPDPEFVTRWMQCKAARLAELEGGEQ
jgi:hypothetical protein